MSPILGGGNLGSFSFKNVSLPQGTGFVVDRRGLRPRAFILGDSKGRILRRWQRNLFAKDTPAPIPFNDRQQNLSANSCLGLRPTTSFFYCLSVTRCLQAMIGIEFGAVFDISQLNYECRHLLLAPSLKLSAELGIDLAWGIPPRRAAR
jgi:hypothetical protein